MTISFCHVANSSLNVGMVETLDPSISNAYEGDLADVDELLVFHGSFLEGAFVITREGIKAIQKANGRIRLSRSRRSYLVAFV